MIPFPRIALGAAAAAALVLSAPSDPAHAATICKGQNATIVGTPGNDTILGTNGNDVIASLGGDDTVYGLDGNDILCLGDGNDIGWGAGGTNQFLGGPGDDRLWGNAVSRTDVVVYEEAPGPVNVDLTAGDGWGAEGVDDLNFIGSVVGSFHDDVIVGDAGNNVLSGNYGNDFLDGRDGADHLRGGDGEDGLFGNTGNDRLEGMGHHDQVEGGPGADALAGSFVNQGPSPEGDTVSYAGSPVGVQLDLTAGTAVLSDGHDIVQGVTDVRGSDHDDTITGNAAANFLDPGAGEDVVSGLGGNDTIYAGSGDDVYDGGSEVDRVTFEGQSAPVTLDLRAGTATYDGNDVTLAGVENVDGTPFADVLVGNGAGNLFHGGLGDDTVSGGRGSDVLHGDSGSDLVRGAKGSDVLFGAAGADKLAGGRDSDTCDGGTEADRARSCETVTAVP